MKKIVGRKGLYEFLPITIGVEDFILKHGSKVSNDKVKKLYKREDITTLYQNALWKTFHPISTPKGNVFMNYKNAIAGSGADVYDWGKEYKDASYVELNTLLKKKKTERKILLVDDKLKVINTKIVGEEKMINSINKEEKEAKIFKLKIEQKELLTEKKGYLDFIESLGLGDSYDQFDDDDDDDDKTEKNTKKSKQH